MITTNLSFSQSASVFWVPEMTKALWDLRGDYCHVV